VPRSTDLIAQLWRCGDHACSPGGCLSESEHKTDGAGLRRAAAGYPPGSIPSIVPRVLRTPGSALSSDARALAGERFGRDFANVRVHTDSEAAESARAVSALAYTVGTHVVFGAGRYDTSHDAGRSLLVHELVHVAQHGHEQWSPDRLRISRPGEPGEELAARIGREPPPGRGGPSLQAGDGADSTLWRTWEDPAPGDCTSLRAGLWLQKVVVDQEKAQSVQLHWSDGSVTASICSTGKGHCCVDETAHPDGVACTASGSQVNGSNCTPITSGTGFTITDRFRVFNTWRFWNTFEPARGIALHQHPRAFGTPLSHGCVRLPEETARAIFCGERQGITRVEVRGFSRPDCDEPELQAEWRQDFATAGATVTDGETPERARIIRKNREEAQGELRKSYGRALTPEEISRGSRGELAIPRCGASAAEPTTEERRGIPETGTQANVPTTSTALLAQSGFERFIPIMAVALRTASSFAGARRAVQSAGHELWNAATAAARGGRGDDRPVYWARLALTRTIRQWEPGFRLSSTQRDELLSTFEQASRGMDTVAFPAGRATKRLLISGFDPFGFDLLDYGRSEATNPSGAAALALDGRTITNGRITGRVESVVFPVSYAAFDAGMVEGFFGRFLTGPDRVDLIMTISMGAPGAGFEVEEWAGRRREAGTDNPAAAGTAGVPPGLRAGPEFIRGTLPAAARGALGRTAPIQGETEVTEIPAGDTRPVYRPGGPTPGSTSVRGSGGGFLSNEIFYRVSLLRLSSGATVPYGHLHVPFVSPSMPDFSRREADSTRQIEQILVSVLPSI